jgi:hypothetical protein
MYAHMSRSLAILFALFVLATSLRADTYSTYKTTRYYSANKQYILEVTPKRRATLYHKGRRRNPLWTRTIPILPNQVLVKNDGSRVAIIDNYYGNGSNPNEPVVIFLNDRGIELARYQLGMLANLSRVVTTTSDAEWYREARLTSDESTLVIESVVAARDPAKCAHVETPEEADECSRSVPYEQFTFATATGKLTSRIPLTIAVSGMASNEQ